MSDFIFGTTDTQTESKGPTAGIVLDFAQAGDLWNLKSITNEERKY